jgi:hypothetical protein
MVVVLDAGVAMVVSLVGGPMRRGMAVVARAIVARMGVVRRIVVVNCGVLLSL